MNALPSGCAIEARVSLQPFTSWQVGGLADLLVQPKSIDDLREAVAFAALSHLPVTVLGGGTNVLISDSGIRGLTIALRKFSGATAQKNLEEKRLQIECLSGTSKSELLKIFLKEKLEPALFLAGLPGDVGGGVVMNAGVAEKMRPREFTEIVDWIEVLRPTGIANLELAPAIATTGGAAKEQAATPAPESHKQGLASTSQNFESREVPTQVAISKLAHRLELIRLRGSELKWTYRHCDGWRPGIVTRVGISWELQPHADVLERVRAANQLRLSKQPLDLPSCGSVFKNPEGHKSGQLIESAGLKGFSIGGAKVSEKHANFIVNFNSATAQDIDNVIRHVQDIVLKVHGVNLNTEVVYLGDW